jgi:1-acyl-sn-glycerol-3-phosphate acyltransferase
MSSRRALRRVRKAYVRGGEGALEMAFADVRWRTRGFRTLLAAVERFYPMSGIIRFAGEVDRGIRGWGLSVGCRAAADRLGLPYEFEIPEATRQALAQSPAILYGNHPTLFTPFLVGAAVDRPDVRFFMLSYVGRLIPALRTYMLPLEASAPRRMTEWRRGGTRRMIAYWLTGLLERGRPRDEPKSVNQRRLMQGVDHVRSGGCVVIFPNGGGRGNPRWYPGVGVVAAALARGEGDRVVLVPMREEGGTNRHVYALFRRAGKPHPSEGSPGLTPIRIRFGNPVRLSDLAGPDSAPGEIVTRLQAHYETVFPTPRRRRFLRLSPDRGAAAK